MKRVLVFALLVSALLNCYLGLLVIDGAVSLDHCRQEQKYMKEKIR